MTGYSPAAACGEVGLLGEEAAQRLLSIFSEAAGSCLSQIHTMSMQHGQAKHIALYNVGLDLVQRWEPDVVQEEVVRIETTYPEVQSLHSFAFLWLLDSFCHDSELHSLSVPPLAETYACFMKRVAAHRDTRNGPSFMTGPELYRRTIYVEAFRGTYHDLLQRRKLHSVPTRTHSKMREPQVTPEEAASQVGVAPLLQRIIKSEEASGLLSSQTSQGPSALQTAMRVSTETEQDAGLYMTAGNTGVHLPTSPEQSNLTKAVSIDGPCFFNRDPSAVTCVKSGEAA